MRRGLIVMACAVLLGAVGAASAQKSGPVVEVFKSPTCGCCGKWVEYLKADGFTVRVKDVEDMAPIKSANHVPAKASSCHTATVDGYVLEGHVPVQEIRRMLKERPAIAGLAVAGMPIGSPGMEVNGMKPQAYDVLSFDKQGQTRVFASR